MTQASNIIVSNNGITKRQLKRLEWTLLREPTKIKFRCWCGKWHPANEVLKAHKNREGS